MISGALEHRDSMGNHFIINTGDVQRMSAGSGIAHSERNHSETEPVRLLQLWFHPDTKNLSPSYQQKQFARAEKLNQFKLLVSEQGENGSIKVNQDLKIYASVLEQGVELATEGIFRCAQNDACNRQFWLQIASGKLQVNQEILEQGDGVLISDEEIKLKGLDLETELLVFDLAKS